MKYASKTHRVLAAFVFLACVIFSHKGVAQSTPAVAPPQPSAAGAPPLSNLQQPNELVPVTPTPADAANASPPTAAEVPPADPNPAPSPELAPSTPTPVVVLPTAATLPTEPVVVADAAPDTTPAADPYDPLRLPDIHAFVSQGFILSSKNNYLANSTQGSVEMTEAGINLTKALSDRLRVGLQLFTRKLGPNGNYVPQFDWYYLDYHLFDWLGLRAGRIKVPFGLYNEINDADMARVPILLPQSVYPNDHRDYLLAQTGGELYGNVGLGVAGELEYRLYAGTIFIDTSTAAKGPIPLTKFDVPYVYGGRLMWTTPLDGLQAGISYQGLRLDSQYTLPADTTQTLVMAGAVPADFTGVINVKIPLKLWVASVEYTANDLLLAAEYGRWIGDVESTVRALLPNSHTVNERYYGMASYRVTPWFTPGAYYSVFYLDVAHRDGRENYQQDFTLTLRFDITTNWLAKIEGHFIHGTSQLESGLNDGKKTSDLAKNWQVLMLKTTAYF